MSSDKVNLYIDAVHILLLYLYSKDFDAYSRVNKH